MFSCRMEGTFPSLVELLDLEILIVRTSDFVLRSWCTLWYLLLFGFQWTFLVSVCSVSASPHPTPEGDKGETNSRESWNNSII